VLRDLNESDAAPPVASGVPREVRGTVPGWGFTTGGPTLMLDVSGVVGVIVEEVEGEVV
jgi:hypothetical protein